MSTDVIAAPRVVLDMPDEEYRADPALSCSSAKRLLAPSCPAIFRHEQIHGQPPKAEFDFGHAAHALVLGMGAPIVAVPDDLLASNGAMSTKAAKEFVAEHRALGETVLKAEDVAVVEDMAAAFRSHPDVGALFNPKRGNPEVSLFWHDEQMGIDRKARFDWLPDFASGRLIVPDYKSAASAYPGRFARAMADFNYHMQAAWYSDAALACLDVETVGFVFVVQEKTAPYLVSIVEPDAQAIAVGRAKNTHAMEIYRDCLAADVWPGYSTDIELVSLPAWADREYL